MAVKNTNNKKNIVKKVFVRFANHRQPKKANQIATKLIAVCCPAFSLA